MFNDFMLSVETVKRLKSMYPKGTRVELNFMDDVQAPPTGTLGTVIGVDDMGTIHVSWDNGSSLGVAYGVDSCSMYLNNSIQDLECSI